MRAMKRLDPCTEPTCKFANSGACSFGLRHEGCYLDPQIKKRCDQLLTTMAVLLGKEEAE